MMREYDPCMGCEYYNKPYWSVVSPCKSCPRVYGTGGYVTTTTTNIKVGKFDDSTTNLPSAKEYREVTQKAAFQFTGQWSEPKYQCPECGGGMCRNEMITLTSYPAQYLYQCDKCGHKEYQYM